MEKQINTSENVNPSTVWKRSKRKATPSRAEKETRNCPAAVMKNEALYCICDLSRMAAYFQ